MFGRGNELNFEDTPIVGGVLTFNDLNRSSIPFLVAGDFGFLAGNRGGSVRVSFDGVSPPPMLTVPSMFIPFPCVPDVPYFVA